MGEVPWSIVSRSRFRILGLCVALAACGEKFVANGGPEANGGASSAGAGTANTAGKAGGGSQCRRRQQRGLRR